MTVADPISPTLSELELDAMLRRLHLANMRRVYSQVIIRAEQEQWPYRDFLTLLIANRQDSGG